MQVTGKLSKKVGARAACSALGVPRATFYRHRNPSPRPARERPRPPLALSAPERQQVVDVLHSPRFVDRSPHQPLAIQFRVFDQHRQQLDRRLAVEQRRNERLTDADRSVVGSSVAPRFEWMSFRQMPVAQQRRFIFVTAQMNR